MGRAAWAVFRKELAEALRDRRTLTLGLLIPVLVMPAVTLGLPYLARREQQRLRDAPARVAVVGGEHLTPFLAAAAADGALRVVAVSDPRRSLRAGRVAAVMEAAAPEGSGPVQVRLVYDEASTASVVARRKIEEALARYSLRQVEERLAGRGVDPGALLPVEVEAVSIRSEEEAGRLELAGLLPFFMTIWMMLGGQYAALDLGAGERERGTLPGLLVTPPGRFDFVLGKFGTVFLLATASVVLVVGSVLLALALFSSAGSASPSAIPVRLALPLCGAGLAMAAALSATQLLLSLVARSVREAQQLFTPLYLLVVAGVVLAQLLPEWGQRLWLYLLPGLNGAYLLRGVLMETVGVVEAALALAGLGTVTLAALVAGAWVYRREILVSG
ncbi:MAG: ABC transporter permease subunit [bacterium]